MNQIEILTRLSDSDRKLIEDLTGAVALLASVIGSMQPAPVRQEIIAAAIGPSMTQAEDGTVKLVPAAHPADAPTAHLEPPAPASDPVAAAPAPVSLGDFQKALVTRCAESAETKAKVQALVHRYAESVSAIPEDKRPEVLAALAQI